MNTNDYRKESHDKIDYIFRGLFPAHGMAERPVQIELSHRMLDAMLEGRIALCDAGTGIGKTFSYLVAGAVFLGYRVALGLQFQPIVTSIALQKAVSEEYLPLLSGILLEGGLIERPLRAVIRKGKGHYVCDERLDRRLRQVDLKKKNAANAAALLSLKYRLDIDEVANLSGYDRERVCVPQVCDCDRGTCRYRRFLEDGNRAEYSFQICNHNLLLADATHRSLNRRTILPEYPALVVDEAHKLAEAARQMFGVVIRTEDFETMAETLRAERFLLASENLNESSRLLRDRLSRPLDEDARIEQFLRLLIGPERCLQVIQKHLDPMLTPPSRNRLNTLSATVTLFCNESPDVVYYAMTDDKEQTSLCATVADLSGQLKNTLWHQPQGMVLTSATLAAGGSFRRFREETGLLSDWRVVESVSLSTFDYERNCLLYFPEHPTGIRRRDYYDELAAEMAGLLNATCGHALALFTSYAAMSAVRGRLKKRTQYPLFTMGRNAVHTVDQFKRTPGAVLLASGPAWEGFDFPGDCVSLLVIPRLPFSFPDALKEHERKNYKTLQEFIRAVVLPEMQLKLRQGFGRAIRTETDSCVIAILDERAAPGARYYGSVRDALPEMPVTRSLRDVKDFILQMKPDEYFGEAGM